MTTPAPTINMSDDLNYELKSQYDGLSADIKKYFDTKEASFLNKSKSKYSPSTSYNNDRGEFLINQQIDNLDTYRTEVWNYLTNEFNKNTQEKYLNAKLQTQNKKDLEKKQKELNDLIKKQKNFSSLTSTNNRQREIVLYEYNRRNDQLFIMKIIAVVLLVCLIINILILNELIPYEFIYLILVIFLGLIIYVIYYMYFKDLGRSKRHYDKYVFAKPVIDFDQVQSLTETQIEDVDKKMDKDLDKYLDDNSCPTPTSTSRPRNRNRNRTRNNNQ